MYSTGSYVQVMTRRFSLSQHYMTAIAFYNCCLSSADLQGHPPVQFLLHILPLLGVVSVETC